MAGSDQSVNLGGMLNQISTTVGQRADAYAPVLKAATKPRGDMNDPAHLMRLAEWARSNGDPQSAASYAQQSRRLSDQATADAKQLRAEQGSAAMGNIQKGMNDVLNSNVDQAVKDERMAALESAAMSTAARYGMDGQAAAAMGGQARENQMRQQTAAANRELTERALNDKKVTDELEQASASMDAEKFETFKKGQIAKGNGAAVKRWETAQLTYENAVREANEAAAESGPLSEAEIAEAKELGISVEGNLPRNVRSDIRRVKVAKATQVKTGKQAKTANASVIKSLLPAALEGMESANWIFDTNLDDWIDDALDDPAMMEAVAAFAEGSGTVEQGPEVFNQLKEAIRTYAATVDPDVAEELAEDSEETLINKYL